MTSNSFDQERFGLLLGQIARSWRIEIDRRLSPFGLTESRWLILMHLSRLGAPITQIELANKVGVKGPTLVRTLDWLEAEGLIERRLVSGDRRAKSLHLTNKAAPVLKRIQCVTESIRSEIFTSIGNEDIATCLRTFEQIANKLGTSISPEQSTFNLNKTIE